MGNNAQWKQAKNTVQQQVTIEGMLFRQEQDNTCSHLFVYEKFYANPYFP